MTPPADVLRPRIRTRDVLAFLLGMTILFNVYLNPGAGVGSSFRMTDLVGGLLLIILLARFIGPGLNTGPAIAVMVMALIPTTYAIITFGGGFPGEAPLSKTTLVGTRWLLAGGIGYALHGLVMDERTRMAVLLGLITGAAANALVILAQALGYQDVVAQIGLASATVSKSWVYGITRPDGMHSMANGSMAVVSLGVPAVFYLYWTGRVREWACVLAFGLLAGASSLTFSRGSVIATFATLSVAVYRYRSVRRTATMALIFGCLIVGTIVSVGPPGGWQRWGDEAATEQNFDGRMETVELTLTMVAAHPLGVGVDQALRAMDNATGMRATHNAVLNSAISFGLPFGLFVALVLVVNIACPRANAVSALYFIMSLQAAALFCFEDLLLSPTVISFFGWLAAGAGGNLLAGSHPKAPLPKTFRSAQTGKNDLNPVEGMPM